jgi:hypothetical protein
MKTQGYSTGDYTNSVAVIINRDGTLPVIRIRDRFGYPSYGSGPLMSATQSAVPTESYVVANGRTYPVVGSFQDIDYGLYGYHYMVSIASQDGYIRVGVSDIYKPEWGLPPWSIQWSKYTHTDGYGFPCCDYRNQRVYGWDGKSNLPVPASFTNARYTQIGWRDPTQTHLAFGQPPDTIVSLKNYLEFLEEIGDAEAAKLLLPLGLRSALATAYSEAIKSLPKATTNSFANVLSTLDTVKGLVSTIFHPISSFGEFGRSLSKMKDDAAFLKQLENFWLQYRYVFNTTKADVEEYRDVTHALSTLIAGDVIHTDGSSSYMGCAIKVSVSVKTNTIIPKTSLEWLQYYGFNLTLVNAWDMVPFSFVVDWFTHLGDILDWIENQNNYLNVIPDQVWFSASGSSSGYSGYIRVPGYIPREIVFLDLGNTSAKTIFKRIVDGICLFGP